MLDDHIQNLDAMVEKNLQFLFGALGRMLARQDRSMGSTGVCRQTIAGGRRQNFLATRAKDRYVLNQALAAYAKMFRDLATRHRSAVRPEPSDDLAAPAAR